VFGDSTGRNRLPYIFPVLQVRSVCRRLMMGGWGLWILVVCGCLWWMGGRIVRGRWVIS